MQKHPAADEQSLFSLFSKKRQRARSALGRSFAHAPHRCGRYTGRRSEKPRAAAVPKQKRNGSPFLSDRQRLCLAEMSVARRRARRCFWRILRPFPSMLLPTEPCNHNGIGRTDWQLPLPGGRPILLEEDEGDREILLIRKPIRGGIWSLCTSASMLYQLSHATLNIIWLSKEPTSRCWANLQNGSQRHFLTRSPAPPMIPARPRAPLRGGRSVWAGGSMAYSGGVCSTGSAPR